MAHISKSGIREIFDLAQSLPDVINLGIGEPDLDTPKFVRRAAEKSIESGFTHYTTNAGIPELRKAIAKKMKRQNGVDVDFAREVIVTAGATQAIFVIMNCILNPGDEVILPTPLFTAYHYSAKLAGGVTVEIPMSEEEGYRLDTKKLEKALTSRSKILVLNSPCNPTGVVYSKKDIEQACEFAFNHNLYLVSDEIYENFLYDGAKNFSPASIPEFKEKVITVNGFSKTFAMTGWRLGYAVANEKVIDAMTRYNMYNAVCAPSFVQAAGVRALKEDPRFFQSILRKYEERKKVACERLDEIGFDYVAPRGAFYIFPKLGGIKVDSVSFCKDMLLKSKVATVPGSSFGKGGEGHMRISYALDEDKIRKGFNRIRKYKERLK